MPERAGEYHSCVVMEKMAGFAFPPSASWHYHGRREDGWRRTSRLLFSQKASMTVFCDYHYLPLRNDVDSSHCSSHRLHGDQWLGCGRLQRDLQYIIFNCRLEKTLRLCFPIFWKTFWLLLSIFIFEYFPWNGATTVFTGVVLMSLAFFFLFSWHAHGPA